MTEYHVGCGAFGIYAGKLNKNKTKWIEKSEVTDECVDAAALYLLKGDLKMRFRHKDKTYEIRVDEVKDE